MRNPRTNPRARVVKQHDFLETHLIIGRESPDELLDRPVDRSEYGQPQQVRLASLKNLPTKNVRRDRAHHEDNGQQRQKSETRKFAPEPPCIDRHHHTVDQLEQPDERRDADDKRNDDDEGRLQNYA